MKKLLLASSALVATAGVAAADVSISGYAEMGIVGGDAYGDETQFFNDWDATFAMSGTTDNGLEFGASVDLDEAAGLSAATGNPGATVFISGGWGTLTMGDTDGAADWATTETAGVGNPGSIDDAETVHAGALNNGLDGSYDGQILRYDYTMGDFGFAVSAEQDDTGADDIGFGVGAKYSMGMLDMGIGYQTSDAGGVDVEWIAGTLTANLDMGLSAGIMVSQLSGDVEWDHIGVGIGYTMDAVSVHANYGEFDGDVDDSGFGLAAAYDLGGGASIHAAYGSSDVAGTTTDQFSFGLAMSF